MEFRGNDTGKTNDIKKLKYIIKARKGGVDLKIRLSEKDIEVLTFLSKYKIMKAIDCKLIYKSNDYYRKRLKVLEKENYIKRVRRIYIKLDINGIKLIKDFGYDYINLCRNKSYEDRITEISKTATLTLDSNIEFIPSWELKDNKIFTETSRKYLGKLTYKYKDFMPYYISKNKKQGYISQIINDIEKLDMNVGIIIFLENMDLLNNKNFIFGKLNTIIINPTTQNFEKIRQLDKIEEYLIIKQLYPKSDILLSNWRKANYMIEDKEYIIFMPFIDTEKLYELNIYFNSKDFIKEINILTFMQNKDKIEQILNRKVKITEIDKYLGGIYETDK